MGKDKSRRGNGAVDLLRDAFSAANLRAIMGIVDTGRVLLAQVMAPSGEQVVQSDGRDLFVRVSEVFSKHPFLARLHIPANILWHKPATGDTVALLVPQGANNPGGPIVVHGDAGGENAVPPWLDTESGLYVQGKTRVQSRTEDVTLECGASKVIKAGATATKGVNREGDTVDCGTLVFTPNVGTTAAVLAYFPPGATVPPVTPPVVAIPLSGRTGTGSAKLKAED